MAEEILHTGRIVEITPEFTTVEIVSQSACSACHAKGLCSMSESKTKAVQLPTAAWENRNVGDEVQLALKASMGHKAVWLAYVLPLFVMLATLVTLVQTGRGELFSGVMSIVSVALYYLLLWFFRKKLQNEYIFKINSSFASAKHPHSEAVRPTVSSPQRGEDGRRGGR